MTIPKILLSALTIGFVACACGQKTQTPATNIASYEQVSPSFDADSAFAKIQSQVDFGPRVPNTKGHIACGDYLVRELKRNGADVQEQKMIVTAFDGTKLNSRNIIASYGIDKKDRVLLFAHWDTRPFSDQEAKKEDQIKPVSGANDGGSGVGVLLEIARHLNMKPTDVGVDIIFFDSEDYGPPSYAVNVKEGDWWCLGSQYWGKNPHIPNYKARYGILLDMVGGHEATFYREKMSMYYARGVVDKVWSTARQLGYGKYFVSKDGGAITDDHLYVNQYRNIPSIDIIQYDVNSEAGFGHYWHTQHDDMSNVSKETLKAVGQTVLEVIYKEKELK